MTSAQAHRPIRVIVTDDQTMVRQGLRALLGFYDDIDVVGEAANGHEAIALTAVATPDVVIMDIQMPGLDGIAATRSIRTAHPQTAVLVLTTFDHDPYVVDAIRAGACGFLLKDGDTDDLARAIRSAARGDAAVSPRPLLRLLDRIAEQPGTRDAAVHAIARLTGRERDVLLAIARGLTNGEIAELHHVAEATVKTHIGNIFDKTAIRDRAQAVILAYEGGLITPGYDA